MCNQKAATPQFQSTPPVKAATPQHRHGAGVTAISIHAAREGGDALRATPHTRISEFQSTPPVKAATSGGGFVAIELLFQSTPPVKAATITGTALYSMQRISIHAAREGGDALRMSFFCCLSLFQSTPPVKAATPLRFPLLGLSAYFNPRRP